MVKWKSPVAVSKRMQGKWAGGRHQRRAIASAERKEAKQQEKKLSFAETARSLNLGGGDTLGQRGSDYPGLHTK